MSLPPLHGAALGWLGDEQEAREVAQDALAKAWAARDRYDTSRPFYPWLATIVRNACRDARVRRRPISGLQTERLVSPMPSPLAALDAAEARARVRQALDGLEEDHRSIIVMRHFEGLSYAEIAEALGLAQGTVMSRLYRARKALVRIMQGDE